MVSGQVRKRQEMGTQMGTPARSNPILAIPENIGLRQRYRELDTRDDGRAHVLSEWLCDGDDAALTWGLDRRSFRVVEA
jgi:hypothetical protein